MMPAKMAAYAVGIFFVWMAVRRGGTLSGAFELAGLAIWLSYLFIAYWLFWFARK